MFGGHVHRSWEQNLPTIQNQAFIHFNISYISLSFNFFLSMGLNLGIYGMGSGSLRALPGGKYYVGIYINLGGYLGQLYFIYFVYITVNRESSAPFIFCVVLVPLLAQSGRIRQFKCLKSHIMMKIIIFCPGEQRIYLMLIFGRVNGWIIKHGVWLFPWGQESRISKYTS